MKTVHELIVFADNFQIQIQDLKEESDFPESWNDALLTQLYVVGDSVLGLGTVRDLDVELTIEVNSDRMDDKEIYTDPDCSDYDHVVQCNIEVPSGELLISGCTESFDEASKITVPPGSYGLRIFWSNLDSTDDLGFEGDDHYKIEMWPNTYFEERIIKVWRQIAFQMNPQNN
jgi:hypothetical protein